MGISDDIKPRRVSRQPSSRDKNSLSDLSSLKKTDPETPKSDEKEKQPPKQKQNDSADIKSDLKPKDKETKDSFFDEIPEKPKKKKTGHTCINVLAWLIVIIAVIIAFYKSPYNPLKDKVEDKQSSVESSDNSYEGEFVTQDQSGNSTIQSAPSSDLGVNSGTSATPASTPTISKTDGTIKVLNGSGTSGLALKTKTELVNAGFSVAAIGNAKTFNYSNTMIYFKTDKDEFANLVKEALSSKNPTLEKSDSIAGVYTVVVVVGKN